MRRHSYVLALVFVWAAACSGRDVSRDAGESLRSLVRVDLSYTRADGAASAEPRFDAQAHFVRYRSLDPARVPTLLGFTDFDGIPLDACRASNGVADLDEALASDLSSRGFPAEVSLLDAGRIEVRGPADRGALLPHHYPELVPFVSGVVYGADEARPIQLGLAQTYQVSGEGGEDVGPFLATATAPHAFPVVSASALRRTFDLDVRWSDAPDFTDADPLLLEVKWSSRSGAHTVRCRVRDDGQFNVPHETFDAIPSPSLLSSATVTATRVSRSPLSAPGVGRGELTVELRDAAPLQVLP